MSTRKRARFEYTPYKETQKRAEADKRNEAHVANAMFINTLNSVS
jgi:hypothetical protein